MQVMPPGQWTRSPLSSCSRCRADLATVDAPSLSTVGAVPRWREQAERLVEPIHQAREDLCVSDDGLENAISKRAPKWREAADAALAEISDVTGVVITALAARRSPQALASQGIYLQAANDFTDLIVDAGQGRGRPALRSARTLFEHQIGMLDVNGDPDLADRWLDHQAISRALEPELGEVETRLRGNVVRSYRHRMRKLRSAFDPAARRVVASRPSGFKRQWHPSNLYERARTHSLEKRYTFYRFASAPVHGSAGGAVGLAEEIDDHLVVRHGPAVGVAAYAVLYGTLSMRSIVATVASHVPNGLEHTLAVLDLLDAQWAGFYEALRLLDNDLWPSAPPPKGGALMIVESTGEGRWFEYQPAVERAREALSSAVTVDPTQKPVLDKVLLATTGERVGICVHGAVVDNPSSGAWIDVRTLLDEMPIGILPDGTITVPRSEGP